MPSRPAWLVKRVPAVDTRRMEALLTELGLRTVCRSARCPNLPECFGRATATFMILGRACTRSCRFCAVWDGRNPSPPDGDEPERLAEAVRRLGLRYVVVTSVTRDDLDDGGAGQFARAVRLVRERAGAGVEVLVPDFQGDEEAVRKVLDSRPAVFAHNIETVPRLYPTVRPGAGYARSLSVLAAAARDGGALVKSGLMVGLGESPGEVGGVLRDLRSAGCSIVTIGQYLSPGGGRLPVEEYVEPSGFEEYARAATEAGFAAVASGSFVRSSYRAEELYLRAGLKQGGRMGIEVKLPDLGEDAAGTAQVTFWYFAAGDRVEEGQDLVEMMTDKATFNVPSPAGGRVGEIRASEGETVQVGDVLAVIEAEEKK